MFLSAGEYIFLPLAAPRGGMHFLTCSPFPLQSRERLSEISHITPLWLLPFLLPSSTFKGPCDHIGPTWITQDTLPVSTSFLTSAKSLLLCKVTYSQVPGIRMWSLEGRALFCRSHLLILRCSQFLSSLTFLLFTYPDSISPHPLTLLQGPNGLSWNRSTDSWVCSGA